jgi:hypothetical protein
MPAAASALQAAHAVAQQPGSELLPPHLNFLKAVAPRQAEVAALSLPGLRNESGEFNCFLNVVLQCLWRCEAFRSQVRGVCGWLGLAVAAAAWVAVHVVLECNCGASAATSMAE